MNNIFEPFLLECAEFFHLSRLCKNKISQAILWQELLTCYNLVAFPRNFFVSVYVENLETKGTNAW